MCSKKLFRLTMCQSCIKLKKKDPQVAFCLSSVKFCNYVFGIKKMFSVYFLYHFGSCGILFHSEVFL